MKSYASLVTALLLCLISVPLGAAAQSAVSQTVTCCLQKGVENQGYFVISTNAVGVM